MTDSLYAALREAILTGRMGSGTPLSEGSVAEQFSTSKTPAREALARLRSEGLIRVIPYKGYYVSPISLSDAQRLYQVRLILEAGTAELAVRTMLPAQADDLMALAADAPQESVAFMQANRAFHLGIARITRNERLEALLSECMDHLQRVLYLDTAQQDPHTQAKEHIAVAERICARDGAGARQLMAEHIERSQRRSLERVLSMGIDVD